MDTERAASGANPPLGRLQEENMLSLGLVLGAIGVLGLSGFPACLLSHRSLFGQRMTAVFMVLGSLMGWAGLGMAGGLARLRRIALRGSCPGASSPFRSMR